jgi:hypothetical protein
MTRLARIAVVYYGATGNVHRLAHARSPREPEARGLRYASATSRSSLRS